MLFGLRECAAVIRVPFHDILYLSRSDIVYKVILYTKEEQIEFYGSLSQIEKSDPDCLNATNLFSINPENIIKFR